MIQIKAKSLKQLLDEGFVPVKDQAFLLFPPNQSVQFVEVKDGDYYFNMCEINSDGSPSTIKTLDINKVYGIN